MNFYVCFSKNWIIQLEKGNDFDTKYSFLLKLDNYKIQASKLVSSYIYKMPRIIVIQ